MTIFFVTTALMVVFFVSLVIIGIYNYSLKKNSSEIPQMLKNTDVCIASAIDEIKIICK